MKLFNTRNRQSLYAVFVMGLSLLVFPALVLADWSDWWRTPEQRALELYESGDHAALIERSPDENWTALGQFQGEEFSDASSSFASSRESLIAADKNNAATTALYNQAVSDVLAGQYEQAIEHFDEVLAEAPEFSDAQHNLEIAKKLLELQENPENSQDQSGEADSDPDENSESSDSGESSENSENESSKEDASDGENGAESENESEQNNSSSEEEGSEGETPESASEEQQLQEEQQARDALAAEARQEQLKDGEEAEQMMEQLVESEQPLTESEQATEQILRRIPDAPRGLLRRKLEQSHRNEFPKVRDALEPW